MIDFRRLAFPTRGTLQWWETERSKGIVRFILLKGALAFGVLMYLGASAVIYFGGYGALPLTLRSDGGPIVTFLVIVLSGVIWALGTWGLSEVVYASHRRKPIRF